MPRPEEFTEEEVEKAMADSYVALPIKTYACLTEALNKCLEHRLGPVE